MNKKQVLESIRERDIDLILLEELNISPAFATWFAEICDMPTSHMTNISAEHSIREENGESDIVLSYCVADSQYKILIENKIDACAQKDQAHRYAERTMNEVCAKCIFAIVAPKEYLDKNIEAKAYPCQIKYESIVDYFEGLKEARGKYRASILKQAIEKTRRGYIAKKDETVTAFWKCYYDELLKVFHDDVHMDYPETKPADSDWPRIKFKDMPPKWFIQHKMFKGNIDVVTDFDEEESYKFQEIIKFCKEIKVEKVGKAFNLRMPVPSLDRKQNFIEQIENVRLCFKKLQALKLICKSFNIE